jgi:acetyltransferase-like isoleucine patch superfamily enzyme
MREAAKRLARGLALVAVFPSFVSFALRSRLIGRDHALEGSTQALALIPGLTGQYLRRAFLSKTIAFCAPDCVVGFGAVFSRVGARIEARAYVGPRCHIGLATIGADALLAAGVHVPSGMATHGTAALDVPMREQPGQLAMVHIGEGAWIASAAVVMADVGPHAIVGAGAVVTRPIPSFAIAVGVPARVIRDRRVPDAE